MFCSIYKCRKRIFINRTLFLVVEIEKAISELISGSHVPQGIAELYKEMRYLSNLRMYRSVVIYSWAIFSYYLYELLISKINQDEIKKWFKKKHNESKKRFKYFSSYNEMMEIFERDYNVLEFLKDKKYISLITFDNIRKCLEIRNKMAHYWEGEKIEKDYKEYRKILPLIVTDILNIPENVITMTNYNLFEELKEKSIEQLKNFTNNEDQVLNILQFLLNELAYRRIDAQEITTLIERFIEAGMDYTLLKNILYILFNAHIFYGVYNRVFSEISKKHISDFRNDDFFQKEVINHFKYTTSFYESNALIDAIVDNFDTNDFRKDIMETLREIVIKKQNPQLEGAFKLAKLKKFLGIDKSE